MSTKTILSKHADVVELAKKIGKDIGGVDNLQTTNKTSVVAAINEIFVGVNTDFGNLENAIDAEFARKTDLAPLATKAEVSKDIGEVTKLQTANKTNLVSAINELKTASDSFASTYAKKTDLTPLATKAEVSKDIGVVTNLQTTNKTNLVAAINELKAANTGIETNYAKKTDLTSLATKTELSNQISDLIGGADEDNDTLKEIADRVTALAQADKGLVSAVATQTFTETQKQQARGNIGAVSEADIDRILEIHSAGGYVSAYLQASK